MFKSLTSASLVLATILGCGRDEPAPQGTGAPAIQPFLLTAEPTGAAEVVAARRTMKSGDPVVIHGRVQDFVEGLAAFTLVDAALPACGEKPGSADSCETPWDYCCEPDLPAHLVAVELRDAAAKPLTGGLEGHAGFAHLKHAVVVGKAEVDAHGNVTIAATGVFLRG